VGSAGLRWLRDLSLNLRLPLVHQVRVVVQGAGEEEGRELDEHRWDGHSLLLSQLLLLVMLTSRLILLS
jgi:hypothetical protein